MGLCDPAAHRFETARAALRERRIEGPLRGELRSGALDVSNGSVTGEREVDLLLSDESGIEVRAALHALALEEADMEVGIGIQEGLLEEDLQVAARICERGLQKGEHIRLQPDRRACRCMLDQPAL